MDHSASFGVNNDGVQSYPPVTLCDEPGRPISNKMTPTANALVSALGDTEPGYDIRFCGAFIEELPRRLGHNPALDASVTAFVSAIKLVTTHQDRVAALQSYGVALHTLQQRLSCPTQAYCPETLCSLYLMVLCHSWLGSANGISPTTHGPGIAHLMMYLVQKPPSDPFAADVVVTVAHYVVRVGYSSNACPHSNPPKLLQAVFNPSIKLYPWIHKVSRIKRMYTASKSENSDDSLQLNSIAFETLAKIPRLLHGSRRNIAQMQRIYEMMRMDYLTLKNLTKNPVSLSSSSVGLGDLHNSVKLMRLQSQLEGAQGLMLSVEIAFNLLLRHYKKPDELLNVECHGFIADVISLADRAKSRRPFAASYIPLPLVAAWYATEDSVYRQRLQEQMDDYGAEYGALQMMRRTVDSWRRRPGSHSSPGDPSFKSVTDAPDLPINPDEAAEMCCIL